MRNTGTLVLAAAFSFALSVTASAQREYGWYYNTMDDSWDYGWHHDVDREANRERGATEQGRTLADEEDLYYIFVPYEGEQQGQQQNRQQARQQEQMTREQRERRQRQMTRMERQERDRQRQQQSRSEREGQMERRQRSERQMTQADRQRQQQQRQRTQTSQQARRTVTGELVSLRTVSLKGERDKHVLAKVETQPGKVVVVDLGTERNFRQKNIRLNRGEKVTINGRAGRINGKPIMVVERIRKERQQSGQARQGQSTQQKQNQQKQQKQQQQDAAS